MLDKTNNYLYITTGVLIILLVLLLIQNFYHVSDVRNEQGEILIYTPKGLIKTTASMLQNEIANIRKKISKHQRRCPIANHQLRSSLRASINNLIEFIQFNPVNITPHKLEIKTRIIHQATSSTNKSRFKTLLDRETSPEVAFIQQITNPQTVEELLKYFVELLKITEQMLQAQLCERGRINLTQMYYSANMLSNDCHTEDEISSLAFRESSNEPNPNYDKKRFHHVKDTSREQNTRAVSRDYGKMKEGMADIQNEPLNIHGFREYIKSHKQTVIDEAVAKNQYIETIPKLSIVEQQQKTYDCNDYMTRSDKCLGNSLTDAQLISGQY